MKKVLLLSMLLISCAAFAKKDKEITAEDRIMVTIIECENQTKDELYLKVNNWLVNNFNSSKAVVEFEDRESGRIAGSYTYIDKGAYTTTYKQTIGIDIKDGKVRVTISNPLYISTGSGMLGPQGAVRDWTMISKKSLLMRLRLRWEDTTNSLKEFLQSEANNDDW